MRRPPACHDVPGIGHQERLDLPGAAGSSNPWPFRRPRPSPRRRWRPLLSHSCGRRPHRLRGCRGRRCLLGGTRWGSRRRAAQSILHLGADTCHQPRQRFQVKLGGHIGETGCETPALGRGLGARWAEARQPHAERQGDDTNADPIPCTHVQALHRSPPDSRVAARQAATRLPDVCAPLRVDHDHPMG
jgi:hypothetical protein